jgi:hypothetical protein
MGKNKIFSLYHRISLWDGIESLHFKAGVVVQPSLHKVAWTDSVFTSCWYDVMLWDKATDRNSCGFFSIHFYNWASSLNSTLLMCNDRSIFIPCDPQNNLYNSGIYVLFLVYCMDLKFCCWVTSGGRSRPRFLREQNIFGSDRMAAMHFEVCYFLMPLWLDMKYSHTQV